MRAAAAIAGLARGLFWLNAAGFMLASALHRWKMDAQDWAVYFGLAAAGLSGKHARPPSPSPAKPGRRPGGAPRSREAMKAPRWSPPASPSAAIVEQFTGLRASFLLFFLGELVVIAGLVVKRWISLRWLGRLVLLLPVVRLPLHTGTLEIAGHTLHRVDPARLRHGDCLLRRPLPRARRASSIPWRLRPAPLRHLGGIARRVGGAGLGRRPAAVHRTVPTPPVLPDFTWQAYALAVLVALRVAFAQSGLGAVRARIASACVALAALFAAHFLLRSQIWIAPLAAIVLAERPRRRGAPRLITVAWGVEAIALVVAGFALRDRASRLTGLAGFLICIGRLFLHDLQSLDTFARILSFIVLGLILLGASWVYTRYREQIRRYL